MRWLLFVKLVCLKLIYQIVVGLDNFPTKFSTNLEKILLTSQQNTSCVQQLLIYADGLQNNRLWASKIFDASGKIPSGILFGNFYSLGSFDECLSVSVDVNSTKVSGKYCLASIPSNISYKNEDEQLRIVQNYYSTPYEGKKSAIFVAVCVPNQCNVTEITEVYTALGYDLVFSEDLCQTSAKSNTHLNVAAVLFIFSFFIITILNFCATLKDLYFLFLEVNNNSLVWLSYFSLYRNVRELSITNRDNRGKFKCVYGIKVISAFWVLLHNKYILNSIVLPTFNNGFDTNWAARKLIFSGTLASDTFLFLSAFLLAFKYIQYVSKYKTFNLLHLYLNRYLRLTPLLLFAILFYAGLFQRLGSGPLWYELVQKSAVQPCESNWWKALLYIQNYQAESSICITQTWYLSLDMQLYIISSLLIIVLVKKPAIGVTLLCSLTFGSSFASLITGWSLKLNPYLEGNSRQELSNNYFIYYYTAIQTRAGPWLIGIIAAHFFLSINRSYIVLNNVTVWISWFTSFTIMFICIFCENSTLNKGFNRMGNSVNLAIVRPLWSLGVMWTIYACMNGYGDWINKFLSLPVFEVLSKLTYAIYIGQFVVLYLDSAQTRIIENFNFYNMFSNFISDSIMTIGLSFILNLCVEVPFKKLLSLQKMYHSYNMEEIKPLLI